MSLVIINTRLDTIPLVPQIAKLYCQIWREPPWNEYHWDKKEVERELLENLSENPTFAISVVKKSKNNEVLGFCWGYAVNKIMMQKISNTNALDYIFGSNLCLGYITELGVAKCYRRKRLGEVLSMAVISSLQKQGIKKILLRTDKKAIGARLLYESLGFQELDIQDGTHTTRTYWLLEE